MVEGAKVEIGWQSPFAVGDKRSQLVAGNRLRHPGSQIIFRGDNVAVSRFRQLALFSGQKSGRITSV